MRTQILTNFAALALAAWIGAGCATVDVNPALPAANTGYVDFFVQSPTALAWSVERWNTNANRFAVLYSSFEPSESRILRLALAPGRHQLRVSFPNRAVSEPAQFETEVGVGQVTPVEFELVATGTTLVRTAGQRRGATYKGRYGRATTIGSDETRMYRVVAEPQSPQAYQRKEQMPYAHDLSK